MHIANRYQLSAISKAQKITSQKEPKDKANTFNSGRKEAGEVNKVTKPRKPRIEKGRKASYPRRTSASY